jgi:peroxiredoxin
MVMVDLYDTIMRRVRLLVNNGEYIRLRCADINAVDHSILEHHISIEGSPTNTARFYLEPAGTLYSQNIARLDHMLKVIKNFSGFDTTQIRMVMEAKNQADQALYFNYMQDREDSNFFAGPIFSPLPFLITDGIIAISNRRAPFLLKAYNNMNSEEKNSYYGKILYYKASLSAGQPFPLFTLPTPDDKTLSLQDIISKSKVTIIHFWAENSYDRKRFEDELRFYYKQYHDKGLNIVGFSSDNYAEQWKAVLQKEQFPWYNVSDLKGKEGMAEKVYHEYGEHPLIHNTTNVLIDKQGKIIAWDVSGTELQWYLWRSFNDSYNEKLFDF